MQEPEAEVMAAAVMAVVAAMVAVPLTAPRLVDAARVVVAEEVAPIRVAMAIAVVPVLKFEVVGVAAAEVEEVFQFLAAAEEIDGGAIAKAEAAAGAGAAAAVVAVAVSAEVVVTAVVVTAVLVTTVVVVAAEVQVQRKRSRRRSASRGGQDSTRCHLVELKPSWLQQSAVLQLFPRQTCQTGSRIYFLAGEGLEAEIRRWKCKFRQGRRRLLQQSNFWQSSDQKSHTKRSRSHRSWWPGSSARVARS